MLCLQILARLSRPDAVLKSRHRQIDVDNLFGAKARVIMAAGRRA
jgi:hypothetical protein